jgi:hypothetical protein
VDTAQSDNRLSQSIITNKILETQSPYTNTDLTIAAKPIKQYQTYFLAYFLAEEEEELQIRNKQQTAKDNTG